MEQVTQAVDIRSIISYFRECYREDRSRGFIQTVYHRDVEFLSFVKREEELLATPLVDIYQNVDDAEALEKQAYVYRKEKEFLYGTLFIVGVLVTEGGKREEVCAPLVFLPAAVAEEDELLVVRKGEGAPRFNTRLVERLAGGASDGGGLTSAEIEAVEDMLADGVLELGEVGQISTILERLIDGLDTVEAILYPSLLSEAEVRARLKALKKSDVTSLALLSASCMGLFKRGGDTHGILQDLTRLAAVERYSPPLRELLGAPPPDPVSEVPDGGLVPSILSDAQRRVFEAAARHRNVVVVGPPGTGKSYTIATLAMHYLSAGRSVLVTSGRDQAVDVIGHKIEEQLNLKECVVRGGAKAYLRRLRGFIQNLLGGMYVESDQDRSDRRQLGVLIGQLAERRGQLEEAIGEWSRLEIALGEILDARRFGLWKRFRAWLMDRRISRNPPLWELLDEYNATLDDLVAHSRELISLRYLLQLAEAAETHRAMLQRFLQALKARTGGRQEELFDSIDAGVLLSVLPVWLVKLSDLGRVLPLTEGMFDLVIIDEATQCDIASCLPAIQRAKRVLITGDPKQLRHVSFLSDRKMEALLQTHGLSSEVWLNYRTNSVLDLYGDRLTRPGSAVFLNEHYRSLPDIIRFSNHHFYSDRLAIMTDKGLPDRTPAVRLIGCGGARDSHGVNSAEVEAIAARVCEIIAAPSSHPPTIGVLSPFRNQVDALVKALNERIPLTAMRTHEVLVGTAHAFQGEERDIMLISLVLDDQTHGNVARFLEKPDVFNVSITRARNRQLVFHSVDTQSLGADSLLGRYLVEHGGQGTPSEPEADPRDAFADEVRAALEGQGYTVRKGHPVAGTKMDLLLLKDGKSLGVDLIGHPGGFVEIFALDRYRMFKRAGLRIFPLPYSRWRKDRSMCLEALSAAFRGGSLS